MAIYYSKDFHGTFRNGAVLIRAKNKASAEQRLRKALQEKGLSGAGDGPNGLPTVKMYPVKGYCRADDVLFLSGDDVLFLSGLD